MIGLWLLIGGYAIYWLALSFFLPSARVIRSMPLPFRHLIGLLRWFFFFLSILLGSLLGLLISLLLLLHFQITGHDHRTNANYYTGILFSTLCSRPLGTIPMTSSSLFIIDY